MEFDLRGEMSPVKTFGGDWRIQRLTYTNFKQTTLNCCQSWHAPYKRLLNRKPLLHTYSLSAYNPLQSSLTKGIEKHQPPSPSSILITLLYQLPITMQSRASLHYFEFPTITWLWRWLLPLLDTVDLLGLTLVNSLNFGKHITKITKKVGKQLDVLCGLKNILSFRTKLPL